MNKVKIIDNTFKYCKPMMSFHKSEFVEFIKVSNGNSGELLFITDFSLHNVDDYDGVKIAMLVEPIEINPAIYDFINFNNNKFHKILTYDKTLIETYDNVEFYPHGGCWINTKDHIIYKKSKLISIIVSDKIQTFGHKLRHSTIDVLKKNKYDISIFGKGYNPIEYKLEALKDFAFSIVIENSKMDYYFSEKIIDLFITGTIPIYWGCPSIGDFFNLDGIIVFNDIEDLFIKLNTLSLDKYNYMLPAINDNFERAKKYLTSEDWLYNNTNIFD